MDDKNSILIVDDDEGICRSLTLILKKKGYEIETARTGREVMEKARKRFFNVALLDLKLPDMEGVELIAALRKTLPDMAIIMITAYASLETAIQALNEGASAYITKPLNMDEVLATVGGIFERQRLFEEKRRTEEEVKRYKFMVESAHDAIFFKDTDSRYVIANDKTLRTFGLSREKVIGKNDYELMQDKEEARKNVEDDRVVFRTGRPKEVTKHMTGGNGKGYWFQTFKSPQFDGKGDITGLVGVARDITERKKEEEEYERMQAKIMQAGKLAALGSMAAGIAHEINQPLALIKGYVQLLDKHLREKRPSRKKIFDSMNEIQDATGRITRIVEQVRSFTRSYDESVQETDLNRSMRDAMNFIRAKAQNMNISLNVDLRKKPLIIEADRIRMVEVFLNLLSNSMDALDGREEGEIDLRTIETDGMAVAWISDNGMGIPEELQKSIFAPFVTTKSSGKGTGLGLWISHGIIERYGGKLILERSGKDGTTFRIELPLFE